jgi:hypothetical protein
VGRAAGRHPQAERPRSLGRPTRRQGVRSRLHDGRHTRSDLLPVELDRLDEARGSRHAGIRAAYLRRWQAAVTLYRNLGELWTGEGRRIHIL